MGYGDDVEHANIIYIRDIESFLEYIDDQREILRDETSTQEDIDTATENLAEHDDGVIGQLRAILADANDSGDTSLISENYFGDYAAERFNEIYPYVPAPYVNYDAWEDDQLSEFTAYAYDGVTYYMR